MKPNKKDIQKWIDALRSGKYKQTRQTLQNEYGYCCLGVACKIFIREKNQEVKKLSGYLSGVLPSDQSNSPKWLNKIGTSFVEYSGKLNYNLPDLNDILELTFDEIADCLQAIYIEGVLD